MSGGDREHSTVQRFHLKKKNSTLLKSRKRKLFLRSSKSQEENVNLFSFTVQSIPFKGEVRLFSDLDNIN